MPQSSTSSDHEHEHFSLPLFLLTVSATLVVIGAIFWYFFPHLWVAQFSAPAWKAACVFACVSFLNALIEYFFHRYVLHTPAIPWLSRLYRQHTLHHALTRIARKRSRDGTGILFIENKFPIVEPEQGEASFFPWYSLAVFSALITPILAGLHSLLPSFPWFFGGYLALTSSLALYEILHAINHWPLETWEPLIRHPRWGRFWRPVYGFHLRHHAVIDCNESISGFFGLPVADWLFGTCLIPQTLFADGEPSSPEKFAPPNPCWLIRRLDAWAARAVQRQRASEAQPVVAPSPGQTGPISGAEKTRLQKVGNWVTHGVGLASSLAALVILIVFGSLRGDSWHVVTFSSFGVALLLLYAMSAVYHALSDPRKKAFIHRLRLASAFLLVASAYTPFFLTSLRGAWGWTWFGVIWGLAAAGASLKLIGGNRYRSVSMAMRLALSGALLVALRPLVTDIPAGGLILLLVGGFSYAIAIPYFLGSQLRDRPTPWHIFALGGSACHVAALLWLLVPSGA